MSLQPRRTVDDLLELRDLTGDENGAQRVAWTETWEKARDWLRSKVGEIAAELLLEDFGSGLHAVRLARSRRR